jgi:twitching motility protein PilJ
MQRFNDKKPDAPVNSTVIENPRKPVAVTAKPGSRFAKPAPAPAPAAPAKPRRNPKSTGEHLMANLKSTAETMLGAPHDRAQRNPTVSVDGTRNGIGKLLENSSMILKVAVIALIPLIGMIAAAVVSNNGFAVQRYQIGNLYEFMLIPINAIGDTETVLSDLQTTALDLSEPSIPAATRDRLTDRIVKADATASAVIDQYNKVWDTTTSPEFTQTLANNNRLDLQQQETIMLKQVNLQHKTAQTALNEYVRTAQSGKPNNVLLANVRHYYGGVRSTLRELININMRFAKLSFEDARAADQKASTLSIVVFTLALILSALVAIVIARSISGRLGLLSQGASDLQSGDLSVNVDVGGRDEIGVVAQTFNQTVHTLRGKAEDDQRNLERSRSLQHNIGEFLGVAMDVSQGNLTRRGKISNDELGSVVDAFNLMTDEIGGILKDVSKVADQVNRRAQVMNAASSQIVQGAQSQANEANTARVQAEGVSESIRQMATGAAQNAQTAQQTLQASQAGQTAVQDTRNGLDNIRAQMQDLASGIQGLAVRSGEISDVVKTIGGIASQTNLLALGASLEAAGAGDAGLRFMAVADGVRKLAEDAASSAQRVSTLIKSVQLEIQALVSRAEGGAREVEAGYLVAAKAGERLQEIATLAQQSARVAGSISNLAGQQVVGVEEVSQVVQRIASTAGQTESRSVQGQKAADELRALAEQLSTNLSRFQLPA